MSVFSGGTLPGGLLGQVRDQVQGALGNAAKGGGAGGMDLGGMLPGLLGAGALGGIAGVLLSGKSMKKMAKGALTVGGGVAAGALVWNLYRKWSGARENAAPVENSGRTGGGYPGQAGPGAGSGAGFGGGTLAGGGSGYPGAGPQGAPATSRVPQAGAHAPQSLSAAPAEGEPDPMLFLEAMVAAARADGVIDENEQARIRAVVEDMCPGRGADAVIAPLLNRPIDPAGLAARVRSRDEAFAVYKLSCLMLEVDHFMERAYLDALAQNLGIGAVTRTQLESEAEEARLELERNLE